MYLLQHCSILVLFTTAIAYCPNGWMRYDDGCYLFDDSKLSWHAARAHCKGLNADLAVPETTHENYFLKTYLSKIYKGCQQNEFYWFGANDLAVEGDWMSIKSMRTLTFTDWAPNEPSDLRGGNCAAYWGNMNFTWDDFSCDKVEKFVCELKDEEEQIVG